MSIVHVNSNTIRSNRKSQTEVPPLSVRKTRSSKASYCNQVDICDSLGNVVASVVYQPETPLSCGAQVWIETKFPVIIEGNNSSEITQMVQ